ncbi:methylated-DNA--[protein]-cysteine S-methyltransferase [Ruania alkalisoli]|uniref:Methylated-DNA--protein-cysteine methyltransferase n=1 Tax=Ruania alkalisoli TaxID=2779775 RepID=A0A7M1SSU1_9MICO|nr:methylated-DNA--[protein]-cysteine S-methyltransferase [Ruania alkalisoli]QOR70626.1 methylated-DNA--[protein]-cysteine S-methyltransferase [Ruania alkalisoli]
MSASTAPSAHHAAREFTPLPAQHEPRHLSPLTALPALTALPTLTTPDDDAHLRDLHTRLVREAEEHGQLDVAYRTVSSAVGDLLLAATPAGVVRVAFAQEDFDVVLTELAARLSPRVLAAPRRLDAAARQLEEYFAGSRRRFDVPIDLTLAAGFRRQVLQTLQTLPTIAYGRTASYAEVARAAGSERAVRAVGSACATNPVPVLVPCHRVVRSDGTFGGYRGGVEAKRLLLGLEGVTA